ncbi:MAG: serine/threonine protein phosphatase [Flavobacteriaceae bacterium]|nr:serine/threonine protein phosphatase [Flavobacteriaceae bacterium]
MRTLVIGDIHSGLKALQQVLLKVQPTTNDLFIFLGDYVDGWSEAVETVSFLIHFSETHDCIFIRGNHDYLTYRYLKHDDNNPMWEAHGGLSTKLSYTSLSSEEKEKHLQFYENLTNYHIDDQNRLFVHAGFTNLKGPEYEFFKNLVFWDRTLWEVAKSLNYSIPKDNFRYPERLKLFSEIYIGHTALTKIGATIPVNYANLWNIDTGAAFTGPLTILDVDTKKFWQSDPVQQLYPNEKGRN